MRRILSSVVAFLVAVSSVANFGVQLVYADAGTGDYPWATAKTTGGFSEWFVDENGDGRWTSDAETYDPYGFAYRNCTSYVAWRLASAGVAVPYGHALGNAKNWDENAAARGISVDNVPRVGDAAVWNGGAYGHVAYVEAVNDRGTPDPVDDLVSISEYNAVPAYAGLYSVRRNVRADAYIHFPVPQTLTVATVVAPAVEVVTAAPNVLGQPIGATEAVVTAPIVVTPVPLTPNYDNAEVLSADISGDGIDDLITISAASDGTPTIFWQLAQVDSAGEVAYDQFASQQAPLLGGEKVQWLSGDVTGDGKQDLVAWRTNATTGVATFWVAVATESGLASPVEWGNVGGVFPDRIQLGNKGSDNKRDVLIIAHKPGNTAPSTYWLPSNGTSFDIPAALLVK